MKLTKDGDMNFVNALVGEIVKWMPKKKLKNIWKRLKKIIKG